MRKIYCLVYNASKSKAYNIVTGNNATQCAKNGEKVQLISRKKKFNKIIYILYEICVRVVAWVPQCKGVFFLKKKFHSAAPFFKKNNTSLRGKQSSSPKLHFNMDFSLLCTLSLIHIWRCRRYSLCRSRWSPYH